METVVQGVLSGADQAIGHTPLIDLTRLCAGQEGTILAKCEFMNPGGSKKDRIAKQMIDDAEAQGLIFPGQPDQTVVEVTSGNTGCGLAIVCAVRGYRFVSVMSKANSVERVRMMKVLGADVLLVEQAPDSPPGQVSPKDLDLVEEAADTYVEKHGAVRVNQFRWDSNKRAHYEGTGQEIWEQADGEIDAFVEDYVPIDDQTAMKMSRRLAGEEGLFVGTSSGANTAAAMKLLQKRERGSRIVVVLTDTGLKYLSTPLFDV